MKTKSIGKIISVLLAFCLVVTLFTGVELFPASGSTSDTKMLSVSCTGSSGRMFGWRVHGYGMSPLKPNTRYRISLDWENVEDAEFNISYNFFRILIYTTGGAWSSFNANTGLYTEFRLEEEYELAHGKHYNIYITTTSNVARELIFYFGDMNSTRPNMKFNTANWELFELDGSGNATNLGYIPDFNDVSFRDASDDALNNFLSKYTGSETGKIWAQYTSGTYARSMVSIPSGYFARSKMVHIKPGENSTWTNIGYKGGSLAGSSYYRFTMDECAAAGIKSTVNLFVDSTYQSKVTKESDTYDGTTRTVEFYLGTARSSFFLLVGNYGNGALMNSYFKKPKLYKITALGGDITGDNLIDDFTASNIVAAAGASRTGAASGKWTVLNYASSAFGYANIEPSCFGISEQIMHHKAGYGDYHYIMQKLPALSTVSYYQLTLKECQKGGEKSFISINVNYSSAGLGVVYDKFDGINRTVVFQTGTNSDAYSKATLMLGSFNYSTALETYYSEPELYKLTASPASGGVITGDNLIVGFSASTVDLSTAKSRNNAPLGKWVPIGTGYEAFESVYTASDPFYTVNPNGDYDGNGTVNVIDYMIYKKVRLDTKLGTTGSFLQSTCYTGYSKDCNNSGSVDGQDFAQMRVWTMA